MNSGITTLAVIFNFDKSLVLMRKDSETGLFDFIRGFVQIGELEKDGAKRCAVEAVGYAVANTDLQLVRRESVCSSADYNSCCWSTTVSTGVLNETVDSFVDSKLVWIPITDEVTIQRGSVGYGACWLYLNEALDVLSKA